MNKSMVGILDLPNEILLMILKKLDNFDVLYSLVGVNKKLDNLACNINFTRTVDLMKVPSNRKDDWTTCVLLDRVFMRILPQIHDDVECLTVDGCFWQRVLLADLDLDNSYPFRRLLLDSLSSTTCSSSSIVHLRIKMHNFDDCLRLLDGRLSQLHTLIIYLDYIYDPFNVTLHRALQIPYDSLKIINNSDSLLKLKCFSLYVYFATDEFVSKVVPLLHRMLHLEKLTLSLRIRDRNTFIDGNYLHKYIVSQMSHLHTFIFDIVTENVMGNQLLRPSVDDIRRTFIEKGHCVDCYIDYHYNSIGRCHVYSLPFNMERIHKITHKFPGGMFMNVRVLCVFDYDRPFEHDYFVKISHSFPLLCHLRIINKIPQNDKWPRQLMKPEEAFLIIEYMHLVQLSCIGAHVDYVEQFLCNLNTRLPCLSELHVNYEHLVTVTENFTRNATRMNCSKLEHITFPRKTGIVRSKNFYLYFPLLYHEEM
ncbi:unnamed protein product [Rotaria sordida]|uniref:F-box domain-containing protein n=1 Tax=Rotaria sordida TaxID=392033 RepID=A0A819WB35_9BILA|nr:unnamed protein product [Rotaria sordida]